MKLKHNPLLSSEPDAFMMEEQQFNRHAKIAMPSLRPAFVMFY